MDQAASIVLNEIRWLIPVVAPYTLPSVGVSGGFIRPSANLEQAVIAMVRTEHEIATVVIGLVAVEVVHLRLRREGPAESSRRHDDMLTDVT